MRAQIWPHKSLLEFINLLALLLLLLRVCKYDERDSNGSGIGGGGGVCLFLYGKYNVFGNPMRVVDGVWSTYKIHILSIRKQCKVCGECLYFKVCQILYIFMVFKTKAKNVDPTTLQYSGSGSSSSKNQLL